MSPMCWLSQAYFPSATARVFLRSAPTARVGGRATGQRDGQRCVSAGAPDRKFAVAHDAHDGVVARDQDLPVMHQPAIGELRKPFQRIVVGVADRLTAEIARGHHQCGRAGLVAGQPEEQRVQRGVGKHDAEVGIVRGHRVGDRGAVPARHQHDRPLCTGQQCALTPRRSRRCVRAVARSATITANGLSPRRFRVRSSATARSLAASQARWYPPMPLTATMPPSLSSRRACRSAASDPAEWPVRSR